MHWKGFINRNVIPMFTWESHVHIHIGLYHGREQDHLDCVQRGWPGWGSDWMLGCYEEGTCCAVPRKEQRKLIRNSYMLWPSSLWGGGGSRLWENPGVRTRWTLQWNKCTFCKRNNRKMPKMGKTPSEANELSITGGMQVFTHSTNIFWAFTLPGTGLCTTDRVVNKMTGVLVLMRWKN